MTEKLTLSARMYDLWRRFFGSYTLDDPRLVHQEAPYTFYLPSEARLAAIEPGDTVKLIFRGKPAGRQYDAERMWVMVTEVNEEDLTGTLENSPFDMPQIKSGDVVHFKRWHIIQTEWANTEKEAQIPPEPSNQYWDRCFVDEEVLTGQASVQYIYREEPDMTQDGDKYPDSGWRIRADVSKLTDEQYENPNPQYIAIGKVLNEDDSWLHLIDSPIGSKFFRNAETGEFEVTD